MKLVGCECGILLDFDRVPIYSKRLQRPGKFCPVCFLPLDAQALETVTFDAANPADKNDSLRTKLRDQMLLDVAEVVAPATSFAAALLAAPSTSSARVLPTRAASTRTKSTKGVTK